MVQPMSSIGGNFAASDITNQSSNFWIWLTAVIIGALILVNVSGKFIWVAFAVIFLGAAVATEQNGGSLQDLINTIVGKKGTS